MSEYTEYNGESRRLCTHDGTVKKSLSVTVRLNASEGWNITFMDIFKEDFPSSVLLFIHSV